MNNSNFVDVHINKLAIHILSRLFLIRCSSLSTDKYDVSRNVFKKIQNPCHRRKLLLTLICQKPSVESSLRQIL